MANLRNPRTPFIRICSYLEIRDASSRTKEELINPKVREPKMQNPIVFVQESMEFSPTRLYMRRVALGFTIGGILMDGSETVRNPMEE